MLAAPEGRRAGEVDRGPPREPARRRQGPPRARRREDGVRRRRRHRRPRTSTTCPTAAPTRRPWPVDHRGGGRRALPRPLPGAQATFAVKAIYTNTAGRTAYRGPVAVRVARPRDAARHRARQMGIDPVELRRRNLLRQDELPYANPNGMTYDHISPLETFEQAVEMLDYDGVPRRAGRGAARPAATSASGCRTYVEPSTPGFGSYGTEAATIRIEPSGQGERLHRRRLDREQPRDHRRPAHRRRARSATSTTSTPSRATPRSPASAPAPPAAAAGR